MKSHGYAAHNKTSPLVPFDFERREPGPKDVVVEIAYSGICHSDIHQVRDEWGGSIYPMVPGHEIVGKVAAIGNQVTKFKVGDLAGIGVTVETCMVCENCIAGAEPYCTKGMVGTYNARDYAGEPTFGGYANNIVAPEHYVYSISPKLDLAAVAPLLCAGITTYSPLRHWKVGPGSKVGVVGLGGLGHMALKFAHSFGAHVVQFTTSEAKRADALRLGADQVVFSKDDAAMKSHVNSFDFILDAVSAPHDLNAYTALLKRDAVMALVGLPDVPPEIIIGNLVFKRAALSGSIIGGTPETQEMLDYCGKHNIIADVEVIPMQQVNEAFERMLKQDVKYRFVIDMATL
jgi:uncharacterized zinc-type alcohol dehydrogenase-like protein